MTATAPSPAEQLAAMSPEQKRIAIAEACGWKPFTGDRSRFHEHLHNEPMWVKDGETTPEGWDVHTLGDLPDYLNSLDAMHEAEKTRYEQIHGGNEQPYEQALIWIIVGDNLPCEPHEVNIWTATAAQRADAFLLTIPE